MDSVDAEIFDLFNKYLDWVQDNNIEDTIYNYAFYLERVYIP